MRDTRRQRGRGGGGGAAFESIPSLLSERARELDQDVFIRGGDKAASVRASERDAFEFPLKGESAHDFLSKESRGGRGGGEGGIGKGGE